MQTPVKKVFIFFAVSCLGISASAQTLFSYGSNVTDKEEFLRAYNKNKPAVADKEKEMREYLALYTNFKLKVRAAQELRLDTISQIRYDVQNFRDQVSGNYLSNEKGITALIDEAAARAAIDRHVVFFSVPVDDNASPVDTVKAFNAAAELYSMLKKGAADAEAVTTVSARFTPVKYNDAGFVSAFSVPYQFENIIYNSKIGNVSAPFRATKSWYIFKVTEERPDPGKWRTAQLLFAYPPDAAYDVKLRVKAKADSVYNLLRNGLAFDEAAKNFSDDRISYLAGGELPEFSTGKYNATFEKNVFALANDNDITRPFETAFGYHIVKRLGRTALPAIDDASYRFEIKQKVMQDSRVNAERELFAKEIAVKTGYKRSAAVSDAGLWQYADSVNGGFTVEKVSKLPISQKAIISFRDGSNIKGEEWLNFVREIKSNPEQAKEPNQKMWERFKGQVVTEYYKKHLEDYNADFKYQMQEFREGNMLFEVMERNVWSKAGADSVALNAYYNAHKENYRWAPSATVLIFNCSDEAKANKAKAALASGVPWQSLPEGANNEVQADSGRYELTQIPGTQADVLPVAGEISPVTRNADGTAGFVKYLQVFTAPMQRSFPEARGLVINDYQNVLEQQWLETLKKKYPVKVNEQVFTQMIR